MSDYSSSLPTRTESPGDIAAKIVDGTVTSQALAVDSSGKITAKLDDAAGNGVTSQVNGAQQALDVGVNVAGVQVDPRAIRALTSGDTVTAVQGTSPWVSKDQSDGPVTPGTVATYSQLSGGQYNSSLPVLTTGQQAALQVNSSGILLVDPRSSEDHNYGTVGANTLRTASEIGNATGAADFNFGTVGAQTLRAAAQIGNATGAANFGAGTTGAQTLRVASNLYDSTGTAFSTTNPLPVTLDSVSGTSINDYKKASAVAGAGTDNHDYTVTAGKTLYLDQVQSTASGKAKMDVQVETGAATGVFNSYFVQFNSTATSNMGFSLNNPMTVAAGVRVRVAMTNRDNAAEDLYSTISGKEV